MGARFRSWMRTVWRRSRMEREMDAELRFHIESYTHDLMEQGISPQEALRRARLEFGSVEVQKEECRQSLGLRLLDELRADVKYGLRAMRRGPGFTIVAVLTLALGIGANTAIFSVTNAILLRALPVRNSAQLVTLKWSSHQWPQYNSYQNYQDTGGDWDENNPCGYSFSAPFLKRVEQANSFSNVAAWAGAPSLGMGGNGPAINVSGELVSSDFFRTFEVRPAVGRLLQASDNDPSSLAAVVLNYAFWQRAFGGSPSAVGKVIKLNGVPFTIVGVAEPKFTSLTLGGADDLWLPLGMGTRLNPALFTKRIADANSWWLMITGRLKEDITPRQASTELSLVFRNELLAGADPKMGANGAPQILLPSAQAALVGSAGYYKDQLVILLTAAALVLLIGCANIGGLMLARSTARQNEIAVRLALGAHRSRILRQLLTESLVLAILGGVLGLLMAMWAVRGLVAVMAPGAGVVATFDARVLGFTAGASLFSSLLFGIWPALGNARLDLTPALKHRGLSSWLPQRGRRFGFGRLLVVAQAALAVVLLSGAALMLRTLSNLRRVDTGFDAHNLLTFGLDPALAGFDRIGIENLYTHLHQEITGLPGVLSVGHSAMGLLMGGWMSQSLEYLPPGSSKKVKLDMRYLPASGDFFATMNIPLLAGRTFSSADVAIEAAKEQAAASPSASQDPPSNVPVPVVVNQAFVRKYFSGVEPIGQRFGGANGSDEYSPRRSAGYEIVGLVRDVKYTNLRDEFGPTMYVPQPGSEAIFEVRTTTDPSALVPAIRKLVATYSADLPITNIRTQSEEIEAGLQQERLMANLSSLFAAMALGLACLGLYGLLSYEVLQRTRELGIRLALGAPRANLIRNVMWRGLALVFVGIAVGIAGALSEGRLLAKMLYGIKSSDPTTLGLVTLLFIVVALGASFFPARRASHVDPIVALRQE